MAVTTNMMGLAFITMFQAAVAALARLVALTRFMMEPAALMAFMAVWAVLKV